MTYLFIQPISLFVCLRGRLVLARTLLNKLDGSRG